MLARGLVAGSGPSIIFLEMARLIVVSNRLPVTVAVSHGTATVKPSPVVEASGKRVNTRAARLPEPFLNAAASVPATVSPGGSAARARPICAASWVDCRLPISVVLRRPFASRQTIFTASVSYTHLTLPTSDLV